MTAGHSVSEFVDTKVTAEVVAAIDQSHDLQIARSGVYRNLLGRWVRYGIPVPSQLDVPGDISYEGIHELVEPDPLKQISPVQRHYTDTFNETFVAAVNDQFPHASPEQLEVSVTHALGSEAMKRVTFLDFVTTQMGMPAGSVMSVLEGPKHSPDNIQMGMHQELYKNARRKPTPLDAVCSLAQYEIRTQIALEKAYAEAVLKGEEPPYIPKTPSPSEGHRFRNWISNLANPR